MAKASAAIAPAKSVAALRRQVGAAGGPAVRKIQSPKPSSAIAASANRSRSGPACSERTQSSQRAVAKSGNARSCLSTSIHGPGFGTSFAARGEAVSATYGSAIPAPSAVKTASAWGAGLTSA